MYLDNVATIEAIKCPVEYSEGDTQQSTYKHDEEREKM
jgi:hypothetical protein